MAGRIAYLGNISPQGLVLDLDAGIKGSYPGVGTTWSDISNNGNNGTLTNGPTFTGSNYGAIVFDGVNDYVTGSIINTPNQLSVFCFKNPKPRVGSVYPTIISKWTNDAQGQNRSWVVGSIPGGVDYLAISTDGTYTNSTVKRYEFSSSVSNNIWTQIGFTFNNGTIVPYLNGAPVNYTAVLNPNITSIHTSSIPYTLGYCKDGVLDLYYSGSIATAQIYNQALNQFQVWQNFNAYKSRYGIPDIVTDGLVLNLDAGNPYSYLSGSSGTTWTNTVAVSSSISGTLVNGPVYSNGAITFDGVNDYVNCGDILNTTGSFSITSWIRIPGNGLYPIVSKWDSSGANNKRFFLFRVNTNILQFFDSNTSLTARGTVTANTWTETTVVVDGSNSQLYINGAPAGATFNPTLAIKTGVNLGIGCYSYSLDTFFSGNIANTKIYNRALTQTEITQNFNALRGRYGI